MLKFLGALSFAAGSLSAAAAIGGGTTGASFAAPSVSGLPWAHGGGAAGGCAAGCAAGAGLTGACCAASGPGAARRPAIGGNNVREHETTDVIVILPIGAGWHLMPGLLYVPAEPP